MLLALSLANHAQAGQQDFTLHNALGFVIKTIEVSEATNPSWEADVLGSEVLGNSESKLITFSGYPEGVCNFDIRITNMDGHAWTVSAINLCAVSHVEFYLQNGVVQYRTP
jgi:hypothetical protein